MNTRKSTRRKKEDCIWVPISSEDKDFLCAYCDENDTTMAGEARRLLAPLIKEGKAIRERQETEQQTA